jgi:hypothetical protein
MTARISGRAKAPTRFRNNQAYYAPRRNVTGQEGTSNSKTATADVKVSGSVALMPKGAGQGTGEQQLKTSSTAGAVHGYLLKCVDPDHLPTRCLIACHPNSRASSTDRKKSFKVFMPQDSRRRAGITTLLNCQKSKATRFFGQTGCAVANPAGIPEHLNCRLAKEGGPYDPPYDLSPSRWKAGSDCSVDREHARLRTAPGSNK